MKVCPNCFSSKGWHGNTCMVCGFDSSVSRDNRALKLGVGLNQRYIVGRVLGVGGFGITYVVYDMKKKERVAVKEYFPAEWAMRISQDNQIVPNSQSKDAVYRHGQEVFINEAKILCRLRAIPNVVNVRDFFAENGTAYMVMDLLEGNTLSGYMRAKGMKNLPYHLANRIIKETGIALQQVHAYKLLHRDVGPDNIMLLNNGEVRLIDFGATRLYALNSEKSMSVLVKPGFAPIEQYSRSGRQGPWTDVYALAATYYFLVAGKKPPEAPERITGTQLIPLKHIVPAIPQNISNAIQHALEEKWKNRTANVQTFLMEMGMVPTIPVIKKMSSSARTRKPRVMMYVGNKQKSYYFTDDFTLKIGRVSQYNNVVLSNPQVSAVHCELLYDISTQQFEVRNYSSNCTYTSHKVLKKGEKTYLKKEEWIYIQTSYERYIFRLEVV